MSDAQLLAGLDPYQREVAQHTQGPIVVLAGAGTGKTRAMTHRIAYGIAHAHWHPQQVLALTFTQKAAAEMRSRLRGLGVEGVQARTFHSAALRQLRFFWTEFASGRMPEILSSKAGFVGKAMTGVGIESDPETIREIAAEIEFAAVSGLGLDEYVEVAGERSLPAGLGPYHVGEIMKCYSDLKVEHHVLDFEDVLLVLNGVLATRPDIAAKVRAQYRYFVVDEFQDVSPMQYELLNRWLGDRQDICVVGDPAQTIYSFAGATDSYLKRFNVDFPEARTVRMRRNYRSQAAIIDVANSVLRHTERNPLQLEAHQPRNVSPLLTYYRDDAQEAQGIAQRIQAQVRSGTPIHEIAVLFRVNSQSRELETALGHARVPFAVHAAQPFFARGEVKEAQAALRMSAKVGGGEGLFERVLATLAGIGYTQEPPAVPGAGRKRWESLAALVNLAQAMASDSPTAGLESFLAELEERAQAQNPPPTPGVTLATIHAAKGLEWDSVHIMGVSEGLLPLSYAQSAKSIAEERRLVYVALTRARRQLSVSWALGRQGGSFNNRRPSRYLGEAFGAHAVRAAGQGRPASADPVPTPRRNSPQPAVLKGLSAWRSRTARAAGQLEFLVLGNTTLEAIACELPTTTAALAAIEGIGPQHVSAYGRELLRVVEELR